MADLIPGRLAAARRGTPSAKALRRMDLPYGPDPLHKVDLYPPEGPPPHKLIVYIHGGGWVTGNRRGGRQLAAPFNAAGYALASVDYRLIPQTDLAGCVADTASAVAYLLNHADEFRVDPDRCVLMGHSAGAHMAALLATDGSHLAAAGSDSRRLGAVVALDGIFDIASFVEGAKRPALREVFGDDPAVWRRFSPALHAGLAVAGPKFCLMAEDVGPRFVPQLQAFEVALRQGRNQVVSAVVHGLRHAELILLFKRTEQPMMRFVMDNLP